jgi:hypothetical protein
VMNADIFPQCPECPTTDSSYKLETGKGIRRMRWWNGNPSEKLDNSRHVPQGWCPAMLPTPNCCLVNAQHGSQFCLKKTFIQPGFSDMVTER